MVVWHAFYLELNPKKVYVEKLTLMNRYITLTIFSLYFENFYSLSILYSLLTFSILINYNYKLLITKPFSYCTAVLFILCHYLLINDSTIAFNTTSFNNSIINDGLSFFSKYIIYIFSLVFFLINSHFLKNQKIKLGCAFERLRRCDRKKQLETRTCSAPRKQRNNETKLRFI